MGRNQPVTVGVPNWRPRAARPAAALAVGALIVAMLVCLALLSSVMHQFKLSDIGQVMLWLSFGLVGVVVA